MLILVEGSECPEGSSKLAIDLKHAKLDHEVRPSQGNAAPRLYQDDDMIAEGVLDCLKTVEVRRQQRVIAKIRTATSPVARELVTST